MFGVSVSAAERGPMSWRELADLIGALARDVSTRRHAELAGWPDRLDTTWLLSALVQASGATVRWPWVAAAEDEAKPERTAVEAARVSMLERWGASHG